MRYNKLNSNWNAEPNAPEVKIHLDGYKLKVEFYLNPFIFANIKEDDKGELIFNDCYKFSFNSCNEEGYFLGQYRYNNNVIPWGEFYELEHDWEKDFHQDFKILNPSLDKEKLRHFIFFFKDNILECISKDVEFKYL